MVFCKNVLRRSFARVGFTGKFFSLAAMLAHLISEAQHWKAALRASSHMMAISPEASNNGNKPSAALGMKSQNSASNSTQYVLSNCAAWSISSNFDDRTLTNLPSAVVISCRSSSSSAAPSLTSSASSRKALSVPGNMCGKNGAKSFLRHLQIRCEASLMYSRCKSSASRGVCNMACIASFASAANFSLPTARPNNDMHSNALPLKRPVFSSARIIKSCFNIGMMRS
mmetsp:Transcript_37597/g.113568  ORF Transcript_37597/g.113568 Transcript_37597/m.113568 type:complete len:227 (-) Transcript_37597:1712-2392(-)